MTRTEYRLARAKRPGRSSRWCPPATRLAIYRRDSFTCVYCLTNHAHSPLGTLSLDHIRPRSKGGTHAPTNLITACIPCNRARNNTALTRYASVESVSLIAKLRRRKLDIPAASAILATR